MQSGYLAPIILLLAGAGLAVPAYAEDDSGPAAVDWGGFYGGIYGGYGLDKEPASSSSSGGLISSSVSYTSQEELTRIETLLGGVRVGYNHQINSIVMGLEAGLTIGDFGKSENSVFALSYTDPLDPADDYSGSAVSSADFSTNAIATIEGRLGWSAGNWLFYGKAGLAAAQGVLTASQTYTYVNYPDVGDATYPSSAATTGLLFGTSIGIGAEVMVTDNISAGAEYGFIHLAGQTVSLTDPLGGSSSPTTLGDINIHTLRAGINYHF